MSLSSAASRRTSCSRCPSALEGRSASSTRYLPPDCSEHTRAASAKAPPGSLKTYHRRVAWPSLSSEPQAVAVSSRARISANVGAASLCRLALRSGVTTDL